MEPIVCVFVLVSHCRFCDTLALSYTMQAKTRSHLQTTNHPRVWCFVRSFAMVLLTTHSETTLTTHLTYTNHRIHTCLIWVWVILLWPLDPTSLLPSACLPLARDLAQASVSLPATACMWGRSSREAVRLRAGVVLCEGRGSGHGMHHRGCGCLLGWTAGRRRRWLSRSGWGVESLQWGQW